MGFSILGSPSSLEATRNRDLPYLSRVLHSQGQNEKGQGRKPLPFSFRGAAGTTAFSV